MPNKKLKSLRSLNNIHLIDLFYRIIRFLNCYWRIQFKSLRKEYFTLKSSFFTKKELIKNSLTSLSKVIMKIIIYFSDILNKLLIARFEDINLYYLLLEDIFFVYKQLAGKKNIEHMTTKFVNITAGTSTALGRGFLWWVKCLSVPGKDIKTPSWVLGTKKNKGKNIFWDKQCIYYCNNISVCVALFKIIVILKYFYSSILKR